MSFTKRYNTSDVILKDLVSFSVITGLNSSVRFINYYIIIPFY